MDKSQVEKIIQSNCKIVKRSSNKRKTVSFNSKTNEFADLRIYDNLKEFLQEFDFLLEDEDLRLQSIEEILSTNETYLAFMESINLLVVHDIDFKDIYKPLIYGHTEVNGDSRIYLVSLDNINRQDSLIAFINCVLKEIGEVAHLTGIENEYEIVELIE